MQVVIAGGHGQIAQRLERLLVEHGDVVRALIRNPDHAEALGQIGAEPVVCDIEQERDISGPVGAADAVVFAAGAGPGSGDARKQTMDFGGAVKLIEAAQHNGIRRYVMVSAIGAGRAPEGGGGFSAYLRAKAAADQHLAESGLDFTIVRPGGLTDDPGTGRVKADVHVERGSIPRDDVAATLLAVLHSQHTIGKAFELVAGDQSIEEALRAL